LEYNHSEKSEAGSELDIQNGNTDLFANLIPKQPQFKEFDFSDPAKVRLYKK
jgi:hypothetical protein